METLQAIRLTKKEVQEIVKRSTYCDIEDISEDTEFPIQTEEESLKGRDTIYYRFAFKREEGLYGLEVPFNLRECVFEYEPTTAYKVEIFTVSRKELRVVR